MKWVYRFVMVFGVLSYAILILLDLKTRASLDTMFGHAALGALCAMSLYIDCCMERK